MRKRTWRGTCRVSSSLWQFPVPPLARYSFPLLTSSTSHCLVQSYFLFGRALSKQSGHSHLLFRERGHLFHGGQNATLEPPISANIRSFQLNLTFADIIVIDSWVENSSLILLCVPQTWAQTAWPTFNPGQQEILKGKEKKSFSSQSSENIPTYYMCLCICIHV